MRGRVIAISAVIAVVSAVPTGAQRADGASRQGSQLSASDEVKVTGCVTRDAQGTLTITDAAVQVDPYYGSGAAGAKGTPAPLASKTAFLVTDAASLEPHIGHKVTATGKVAPASATSADAIAVVPATGRGGRGTQRTYLPRLNVQAVTMVAASCQ